MDYPKRKRLRLPDYDYSSEGVYFLTLCTKDRAPLLSRITTSKVDGETVASVVLTQFGGVAQKYISSIPVAYPNIGVDSFVIMPDHIHLLLRVSSVPARRAGSSRPTGSVIAQTVAVFKRLTNRDCKRALWQDGYYDHIIRDEQDYHTRIDYIKTNPLRRILNKE